MADLLWSRHSACCTSVVPQDMLKQALGLSSEQLQNRRMLLQQDSANASTVSLDDVRILNAIVRAASNIPTRCVSVIVHA